MPELAGMQSFETPDLELSVFLPIHCAKCYAPYSVHLESGVYSHVHTECSMSAKKFKCEVGSHGQVTVVELPENG